MPPLPKHRTDSSSMSTSSVSSETSSLTRIPLAYSSSSIDRSRFASGVSLPDASSNSRVTSSTASVSGSDLPTRGVLRFSVGSPSITPSSLRNENSDFSEATLRARVVSEYSNSMSRSA